MVKKTLQIVILKQRLSQKPVVMKPVTLFSCSLRLAATTGAWGVTLSLTPDAGTSTRPAHNAGIDPGLSIYGQGGNDFMADIRFDLMNLPAGATIGSAILTVHKQPASLDDMATDWWMIRIHPFGLY